MAKALYREYRPKTFDSVLGQDRVVNVLKNQVKSGKISHAYLFSGERGTGKTSCAKIFAKAINCKNPKDGSPCLECENCKAIEDETTIDIVEMDAASNRRIDDIRNLKDNVIYPPNKLKYKVYIIDEAHMITREAFNALLKIMEEPPSHLVFILATTEIEKIPTTILSRVQKYEFNKIDENKIKEQIDYILADKAISMEKEAISLIIKKANGAMRDALSILDMVLSLGLESYSLSDVENLLGVVDFYDIDKLTTAIVAKDSKKAMAYIFSLRENNKTNKDILDSLLGYFNDIMVYQITGDDNFFENEERLSFIKNQADLIPTDDLADYLDVLIEYANKLTRVDNTDALTEVAILRLVKLKNMDNLESRLRALEAIAPTDIDDLIHKIIDQRLSGLNVDDLSGANARSIDQKPVKKEKENKNLSHKENNNKDNNLQEEGSKENKLEKKPVKEADNKENRLPKAKESQIMTMIIKTAGGIFHQFFKENPLTYKIGANTFTMAVDDDFYKIIIENKTDDIERNLMAILNRPMRFAVASSKDINHNDSNTSKIIEENQVDDVDNSMKLREVFGEDLIIE